MKRALAVLPFFGSTNPTPHLGLACLAASLQEANVQADIYDLRVKTSNRSSFQSPFAKLSPFTQHGSEMSELPALPLLGLLIKKFQQGEILTHLLDPDKNDPVLVNYALERGFNPGYFYQEVRYVHDIIKKHSTPFLEYDLVGFTLYSTNFYLTALMALVLRTWKPEVRIIMGGPQVTQSDWACRFLLKYGFADAVVRGAGERSLIALVQQLDSGGEIDRIPGVMTWLGNDAYSFEAAPAITDLNVLPTPDFSGFTLSEFTPFTLPIYSSRDCPFHCAFCAEFNLFGKYKRRTPERVIQDMIELKGLYGAGFFHFGDSLINASQPWMEAFVERLLEAKLNIRWGGYFRAKVTDALASKLKASGLQTVTVGIESFSDDVLENMDKRRVEEENTHSIRTFLSHGINTRINVISGFPEESQAMFNHSIHTIERLLEVYGSGNETDGELGVLGSAFNVMPMSPIYENPQDFGIEFKFGLPKGIYSELGEEFLDFVYDIPTIFTITGMPSIEYLRRYHILLNLAATAKNGVSLFAPETKTIEKSLHPLDRIEINKGFLAVIPVNSLGKKNEVFEFKLPIDATTIQLSPQTLKLVVGLQESVQIEEILLRFSEPPHFGKKEIIAFLSTLLRNRLATLYRSNHCRGPVETPKDQLSNGPSH